MSLFAHVAILQKRPTWIRFAGQVIAVATMSSIPACIVTPSGETTLAWSLFLGGSAAMLLLAQMSRWTTRTARGALQVDDRGVQVDVHAIPAADLPAGVVCEVVDSGGVILRPRGSTTTIDVGEDMLGPLIEALRLHFRAQPRFLALARQSSAAGWTTFSALTATVATVTVVCALLAGVGWGIIAFVSLVVGALILKGRVTRRRLTIGSDGMVLRNPLGMQTLVLYSQVESVHAIDTDMHVRLKSGRVHRLGFGVQPTGDHFHRCRARAAMLAAVVETARRSYEAAVALGETGRKAAILARGGRAVSEWMNALRNLNEMQASFRSATIPDDELWRIAEDPTEREPVRVAAAIALRDRLDEVGRRRLRFVADSCVAPRLRVALDAAVGGDDPSLAKALEDLDDVDEVAEKQLVRG